MPPFFVPKEDLRRVAVLRALPGLGDFLCVTPALRALRAALPQAHISLIGLAGQRALTARYPHLLDAHLDFPGFPGIPEAPVNEDALAAFLARHAGQFDLALQLHGSGHTSNAFVRQLGASVTAGYFPAAEDRPQGQVGLPYEGVLPEPRRWLHLLNFLGCPPQGEHLEFPLTLPDEAALRAVGEAAQLGQAPYAVVHPGASVPERRWNPASFARVADDLAAGGLKVVLTGSASEAAATGAVQAAMRSVPLDLTGRTCLGAMGALVRRARVVVTNDTGVSHLAAALRTPSVAVFLTSDPRRWAPLDRERHRAVGAGLEEGRAGLVTPPPAEEVLAAVQSLLSQEVAHV